MYSKAPDGLRDGELSMASLCPLIAKYQKNVPLGYSAYTPPESAPKYTIPDESTTGDDVMGLLVV